MTSPSRDLQQCLPVWSSVEFFMSQFDDGLDFAGLFGNRHPLEMEIGSGKGRFIITSALQHPEVNYIGIERAYKFFHIMKQRVEKAGTTNVRLLRTEADYFILGYVPLASVQAFHIYFPDPWPKTKHHKRRLVSPEFFATLRDRLTPGGCINLATDFAEYFNIMLAAGRGCPGLTELYCRSIGAADANPEAADTHYERKYLMHGRTIYRAAYCKHSP